MPEKDPTQNCNKNNIILSNKIERDDRSLENRLICFKKRFLRYIGEKMPESRMLINDWTKSDLYTFSLTCSFQNS